jgi:hypothetical protein
VFVLPEKKDAMCCTTLAGAVTGILTSPVTANPASIRTFGSKESAILTMPIVIRVGQYTSALGGFCPESAPGLRQQNPKRHHPQIPSDRQFDCYQGSSAIQPLSFWHRLEKSQEFILCLRIPSGSQHSAGADPRPELPQSGTAVPSRKLDSASPPFR